MRASVEQLTIRVTSTGHGRVSCPGRTVLVLGEPERRRSRPLVPVVMISSTGFDRASLVHIAGEAGITRNAISRYYANKVELHRAALSSIASDALTIILDDLPEPDQPAMTRIVALFEATIRMNDTDSSFARFWVTSTIDAVHHPALRDQSVRQFNAVHRGVPRHRVREATRAHT